jgi:trehalose/maltose hydrolase-like predicted phosphorylase
VGDGSFSEASGLRSEHSAQWEGRAAGGRLEVEGDLSLAQALNASLYYIRTSVRGDWAYGISPGGLASNKYNGHTFWDQETWMYPPILVLEPDLARSMLQYRFDRMDHAKEKAQACKPTLGAFLEKYDGTFQEHGEMKAEFWTNNSFDDIDHAHCNKDFQDRVSPEALLFPWESATTGTETVYMDGKLGPWGMFEQHLNGDIAFAIRQYYYLTGDKDWLRDVGFPIVNGTASFYSARLEERPGEDGAWDFATVMGPDEYAFPVLNSGYTNFVAQITLDFAVEAARELGHTGAAYSKFEAQAKGIRIPTADTVPGRPDLEGGYHPEYEGFPDGSPGKSYYPASPPCDAPNGCVKQADAVLLSFPLGMEMEPQVLANDLMFYENVTDPNGPAMTWAMFAIGWFAVGDTDRAAKMFPRGFANVHQPFLVWSEYPATFEDHGAVNFITGAGAFLNSVVFGTSGMRIEKERLLFDPPPPSATGTNATRLVVHSLHYLGARLRQEVDEASMRYELLESAPGGPLCLKRSGHGERELLVGKAVGCPRGKAEIRPCQAVENTERRLAFV